MMIRVQGKPEIDRKKYSENFRDFLDQCLNVNVQERWDASKLLKVSILISKSF